VWAIEYFLEKHMHKNYDCVLTHFFVFHNTPFIITWTVRKRQNMATIQLLQLFFNYRLSIVVEHSTRASAPRPCQSIKARNFKNFACLARRKLAKYVCERVCYANYTYIYLPTYF